MRRASRIRAEGVGNGRESGYAYMLSLFMILAVIVTSQAVLHSMVTDGRRERENEMIWRGNQYVRAIRIFYRKTGHYPQSMDDLQKGLPSLQFLRPEVEKDPMNKTDGAWRVIYVNAAGQIIGSVKYASLQQMALIDLNHGKMPPSPQANAEGGSSTANPPDANAQQAGSQGGPQQNPQTPLSTSPFSTSAFSTGGPQPGSAPTAMGGLGQLANAATPGQPTGPVDGPVLGAFVAGVAGGNHYDRPSVKVYKGGKTYQQWEFIWNPLEDQARALQNGLQGLQPGMPGLPVANPNGAGTGPSAPVTSPSGGQPPQTPTIPFGGQPPPLTPPNPDQPLVQ